MLTTLPSITLMETVRFGLCTVQEVPLKLEEYRSERPTLHLSGPLSNSVLVFMSFVFFEQFIFFLLAHSQLSFDTDRCSRWC